jgi:hypothetical protein
MLIINIELLPEGSESLRRTVASMCISDETVRADASDDRVTARVFANPLTGAPPGFADASVSPPDRRQRVWSRLRKACEEVDKAGWIPLRAGLHGGQI